MFRTKIPLVLLWACLLSSALHAQKEQGFTRSFGSSGFSEDCEYIAMDSEGNIWMAGEFESSWSPPSGPGSRSFTTKGWRDLYLVKLDPNGNTLWCGALQNSYDSWMTGIDVDSEDNVIITGAFRGTVDFDPSPQATSNIGAGVSNWHGFLLKLDKEGVFQWARKFGTTGNSWHVYARDLVIDEDDNFIIAGTFANPMAYGSLDFSSAGPSIFVIKADKNGHPIWGKRIANQEVNSRGHVLSIANNGNIYLTGDTFIHRINSNNGSVFENFLFNEYGTTIEVDHQGLYSLRLRDRTDEYAGRSALTHYNFQGQPRWYNFYEEGIFYEFRLSPYGLYAYGMVENGSNVNPSHQSPEVYDGNTPFAGIIQKIDPYTGKVVKNTFFPTSSSMRIYGMAVNDDQVVACGTYKGSTNLNLEDPTDTYQGGQWGTSFLISFTDCRAIIEGQSEWTCKPIKINNQLVSSSGVYYETSSDLEGCIITQSINLEVELFDIIVLSDGESLSVPNQPYQFQWYDCLSGTPVSGANSHVFTPEDDRLYGVIMENRDCMDTSACVSARDFSFTGEDVKADYRFGHALSIYGDWLAISTKNSNVSSSGFIYLFKREGNRWVEQQKLAPTERSGWDNFGDALQLYKDRLAIGAWNDDTVERDAGKVYLYQLINGVWEFEQAILGSDIDLNDRFGSSVALSDDLLVVGAPGKNANGNNSIQSREGAVYVFRATGGRGGSTWQEVQKVTHEPTGASDNFGQSIRIEDGFVFISAPYARTQSNSNKGRINTYRIQSNGTLRFDSDMTYPSDEGLGWDFDVSGDKLLATTNNRLLFYQKIGGDFWTLQGVVDNQAAYDARVRIDGDYAAYITSPLRGVGSDIELLHFENGEWKLFRNFENGGDVNTHISNFDMQDYYLIMGASDNSLDYELGGRVFTHYYRFTVGTDDPFTFEDIQVFPNPAFDQLNIDTDKEIKQVSIFNMIGQSWQLPAEREIDVSFLQPGLYILRIEDKKGRMYKGQFIKI
jgi:hypothetical protein